MKKKSLEFGEIACPTYLVMLSSCQFLEHFELRIWKLQLKNFQKMASLGNALFSALSHTKAGKLIQLFTITT